MPEKNIPTNEDWQALTRDMGTSAKQVKDTTINAVKNWHAKSASKFHKEQNEEFFINRATAAMQTFPVVMETVAKVLEENRYLHLKIIDRLKQLQVAQTYSQRNVAAQPEKPNPEERFSLNAFPPVYRIEILKLSDDTGVFPLSLKRNLASELRDFSYSLGNSQLILLNVKPLIDDRYDLVIKEVPSPWNPYMN